jgi:hypothetical protein
MKRIMHYDKTQFIPETRAEFTFRESIMIIIFPSRSNEGTYTNTHKDNFSLNGKMVFEEMNYQFVVKMTAK